MTAVTVRFYAPLLLMAAACSAAHAGSPLYTRLGGEAGIATISNSLIDRVARDPRLGQSFKDTNLDHIKQMLAQQICELSGGPCRYSGDSMKQSHAGHHISEAEFYGMVAQLRLILKEQHVNQGASNELLRLLAPMRRDIVEPTPLFTK